LVIGLYACMRCGYKAFHCDGIAVKDLTGPVAIES
jgi:hypothetical protein